MHKGGRLRVAGMGCCCARVVVVRVWTHRGCLLQVARCGLLLCASECVNRYTFAGSLLLFVLSYVLNSSSFRYPSPILMLVPHTCYPLVTSNDRTQGG